MGEAWQYLYYVEYDINSDGRMDYVAVHGNPDNGTEKSGFCGGDVWCLSEDGNYERVLLFTMMMKSRRWRCMGGNITMIILMKLIKEYVL